MALISVCSGAYAGIYRKRGSDHTVGMTREGVAVRWRTHRHPVDDTNSFGKTLIEGIYLGADWSGSFVALEYLLQGAREVSWPWGVRSGVPTGFSPIFPVRMGRAGRRDTDNAGQLILSLIDSGTPAGSSPTTFTAKYAILSPGGSTFTLGSRMREMPVTMDFLPYDYQQDEVDGGKSHIWFQTT